MKRTAPITEEVLDDVCRRFDVDLNTGRFLYRAVKKSDGTDLAKGLVGKEPRSKRGRPLIVVLGQPFLQSRLVMALRLRLAGLPFDLAGDEVDHMEGVETGHGLIRASNHADNMKNRKISVANRSGLSGVWWNADKAMWQANIGRDGRPWIIGHYDDFEEAVDVRLVAEVVLYGDRGPCLSRAAHAFRERAVEIRDDLNSGGARFGKIRRRAGL